MTLPRSLDGFVKFLGLLLLLAGVLTNEWVIATFLTGDGEINPPVKVLYVRFANIYLIAWGAFLLTRWDLPRRVLSALVLSLTLLMAVEVAATVSYRITQGVWHTEYEEEAPMFEPHPFLVGSPIPDVSRTEGGVTISHNARGMRGSDFTLEKAPGVVRIVTIGGSSTYNTGVSDEDTWQSYLGELLGPRYEVLNMGVPGYSSAEHVIQTALQLSDLMPDVVVYYIGWNDIRSMHVAGLSADYSSFHGRGQYGNLGLPLTVWTGPHFALPLMLVQAGNGLGWVNDFRQFRPNQDGVTSNDVDERALSIYVRNVRLMITLARAQGISPVLVPQILNDARWSGDEPMWWIPHVPQKDVPALMSVYNEAIRDVSRETSVPFVDDVLAEQWQASDFIDEGHFSPAGQRKFARAVAAGISSSLPR